MRILHISSAVDYGGGERHIVDLSRGLMDRGHDVFAAVRPTNKWQSRLEFIPSERVLHMSIRNSFGVFSARRIGEFVRQNEIEIIHAHVARDYIPASIACSSAKCAKFVLTRHLVFPLKPFNRFALRNLSKAIAVSPGVGESLRSVFSSEKVTVIANGIAMPPAPAEISGEGFRQFHGIPKDAPLVGTVGELTPLKGQTDFVLAAAEVVKRHADAWFVIVGVENAPAGKFRRELKRLAKVLGLADRILWLDWVDDLSSMLAALDLYVSPSHTESFGLATLEAMASAKPVVATATAGSIELLRDRQLMVPVNDPVALAKKISALLEDRDMGSDLGRKLQARAIENFSLDRMVEETEAMYREVLGR